MVLIVFVLLLCTTSVLSELFCDTLPLPEIPPEIELPPGIEIPMPAYLKHLYLRRGTINRSASKGRTSNHANGRGRSSDVGSPLILTPYIEENRLAEAREAAAVDDTNLLPGIKSYAGYVTVNKEYNSNTWFWYFPVEGMPVEDTPWILFLQGGPGASSLMGLFEYIGPFFVTEDYKLEAMPYSWGRNHSLLFIDNPVGTGFSFTDDHRGYATNQETIGENLYNALQQFLTIFPELRKAPLTIAGASYAGKHIPSLAIQILWHREEDEPINLQGIAIGNGYIDPRTLQNTSSLVREMGFVDDDVADEMEKLEAEVPQLIDRGEHLKALNCHGYVTNLYETHSHLTNPYNFVKEDFTLERSYMDFIDRDEVRRALHVGDTEFTLLGIPYGALLFDMMNSAKPWLEEILDNYNVLLFGGHFDIVITYRSTINTYNSLNFTGTEEYKNSSRHPWYHNGILAGYYKTGGNLLEVMVRNAGHMVPEDQPSAALGMISAFARQISLEQDTGYLVETPPEQDTSAACKLNQSSFIYGLVLLVLFFVIARGG